MQIMAWEGAVFSFLHSLWGQSSGVDFAITAAGSYLIWILVVFFALLPFRLQTVSRLSHVLSIALSVLVSVGLFQTTLNFFIRRPDPLAGGRFITFLPLSIVLIFTLAAILFEFNQKRLALWYGTFGTLGAASLVIMGEHWPLDVLIAAAVGILSVLLLSLFIPFEPAKKAGKLGP